MLRISAVFCVGLLTLLFLTNAGDSGDKGKKKKGMIPLGWGALDLTPAQKVAIQDVDAAYDAKIAALQDQITKLKAQARSEMVKHLTEDQKEKLRKLTIGEDTKEKKDK